MTLPSVFSAKCSSSFSFSLLLSACTNVVSTTRCVVLGTSVGVACFAVCCMVEVVELDFCSMVEIVVVFAFCSIVEVVELDFKLAGERMTPAKRASSTAAAS